MPADWLHRHWRPRPSDNLILPSRLLRRRRIGRQGNGGGRSRRGSCGPRPATGSLGARGRCRPPLLPNRRRGPDGVHHESRPCFHLPPIVRSGESVGGLGFNPFPARCSSRGQPGTAATLGAVRSAGGRGRRVVPLPIVGQQSRVRAVSTCLLPGGRR